MLCVTTHHETYLYPCNRALEILSLLRRAAQLDVVNVAVIAAVGGPLTEADLHARVVIRTRRQGNLNIVKLPVLLRIAIRDGALSKNSSDPRMLVESLS